MKMSEELKKRFCKDCNVSIGIYQEPYFMDRIKLFDKFYETVDKWNLFVEEANKYKNEQDYFEEYNRVKDNAINFIKSTEAYKNFNEEDMSQYEMNPDYKYLPSKSIYHPSNNDKTFISIDMKKANFSALSFYNASMFDCAKTWEEFISKFTDNQHIINSKYIRQVIFGNCNPKRHIRFEEYLMEMIFNNLLYSCVTIDKFVYFSCDELVIDVSDMSLPEQYILEANIKDRLKHLRIPLKIELFKLHKFKNISGYYKAVFKENGVEFKLKGLDSYILPFVLRWFKNEEVTESDRMFYHNGLLAKFEKVPKIEVE